MTAAEVSPTKKGQKKAQAVPIKPIQTEEELLPIEMRIELSDKYTDQDFKIYFDKKTLLDHLNHLEDDNLFRIYLVQEEE